MKFLKIITLITIIVISITKVTYAETDVRGELDSIEGERKQKVEQQLLLDLPEISDNPNHIVTFRDPSGTGIQLEIDGKGFNEITSPYTLPSLGLGRHTLTFKFKDEENTEQILERTITIIPRAPIVNTPEISENEIKITGTAMPKSEIEIFLTNNKENKTHTVVSNEQGDWEWVFDKEEKKGSHTLIALTRSRGFASKYSEPLVFNIDNNIKEKIVEEENNFVFSFKELNYSNIISNRELLITLIITNISGLIIGYLFFTLISNFSQKKSKQTLREILKKKDVNNTSLLKDKLEKENKVEKTEEIVQESKEKEIIEENKTDTEDKEAEEIKKDIQNDDKKDIVEESKKEEIIEDEKIEIEEKEIKMSEKAKNVEKSLKLSKEEFLEKYKGDYEEPKKKESIKISLTSKDE